ncbi:hypothetical protein MNEG_9707 [Monoraphidium neglectum]|uniref:SnoaL-like domain-containing protein n=1 Tax=Monoraphidium neglectum TaxID=145388 RepID=A0A0D2MV74_9CHLO|nr:hypothetical protein MNEG_9707 [Monoraphidium neglectum]KIY98255.1 hypothetical protein MNEG_9707 [Monoraphidium neglectum]|eukprot:XP_013897275.1 hypothetical protein MNEG_9707 [Monoraphidium neglectum]
MLGACNVNTNAQPELRGLIKKWAVFKPGAFKVGVLGWLTPDTKYLQLNSGNVTFGDVIPSVRRCVADLKRAHTDLDLIIGMSHTGYSYDLQTAKAVPELDLILGAADCVSKGACDASAGLFPTIVKTKVCSNATTPGRARCTPKEVPVVQAYYASKYLGSLKIDMVTKKLVAAAPVLLGGLNSSHPVAEDPSILHKIRGLAGPVKALEGKVAGRVALRLVAGNTARQQETNFGDYMASLLVRRAKALPGFEGRFGPVDVGLFTGGGFRTDIEAGNVTYGQVLTAMPYGNLLAIKVVAMTDKVIYNLASNSYVLSGGDDYTMFTERPFLFPSGDTMDALMTSDLAAAMPKPSPPAAAQQQQAAQSSAESAAVPQASAVVRRFYEAYNTRDLDVIQSLIADDISYHDLVYEEPHEGREGVMAWLEKVRKYAPDDLKFVIEDITEGDPFRAGVQWHVECGDGVFFPFSRGCSFIRVNERGQIVSVRDVVEPSIKPGDSTLQLLGSLTPLIRSLGPAANPANLKPALNAAALWGLYAAYLGIVMFSTLPPGPPAYATPQPVLLEAFDESVNIFWINEVLRNLNLSPIPVAPHHPVSEVRGHPADRRPRERRSSSRL